MESDQSTPAFDEEFARTLVGKSVLIGITVHDQRGQFKRREQFFGTVMSADRGAGIAVALGGKRQGELKRLPPVTSVFEVAEPGTYALRDTGEEVVDPAFISTWSVTEPDA